MDVVGVSDTLCMKGASGTKKRERERMLKKRLLLFCFVRQEAKTEAEAHGE